MDQYRKEIEKYYNRVIKIASKGESQLQYYYDFIDEMVDNGKMSVLQDLMYTKFKIDTTTFGNINDLKKNTFKKIAFTTTSKVNSTLDQLLMSKKVERLGTQFFDKPSGQYLGEIIQFNEANITNGLEVFTFVPKYMDLIPKFVDSPKVVLTYKKDLIVYYGPKLYQCSREYTWDKNNQITPTYSAYWFEVFSGTQSLSYVIDQSISIIDRYSEGIDILRKYYYIDYSRNFYVESNFIDEYFE